MNHRDYFVNSKKMGIKVIPYLILENIHYNQKGLNTFKPAISYLGISRSLYNFYMKQLMGFGYIKIIGKTYVLTSKSKKRLDNYLKDKTYYIDMFEKFWAIYPLNTDKKKAQDKFFALELDGDKFKEIIDGTKRQLEERKAMLAKDPNKFIPEWTMPATYLYNERWNDVLMPKANVKTEIKNVYKKEDL